MTATTLPQSRVPASRDASVLRWGIMGPGWIAERFTESIQAHTGQVIAAVGSRSLSRSKAFAEAYDVAAAYGSYKELAAAPDIDVVYVCTPHTGDHAAAALVIDTGKHVLIEKPLGLNTGQARDIARRAEEAGVFAAEAMWTFFLPKFAVIRQILDAGTLGTITTVFAEYGEHFNRTHVHNFTPTAATVVGSEAPLTIEGPFNMTGGFEVRFPDGTLLRQDEPAGGHFEGLHYEAAAVARAIAAGSTQASQRTLGASVRTLEVADEIRRQLRVVFPGEAGAAA